MPPPVLMDELVEEVLLRLPPDEPACLVRASAVCKPWRRVLAGRRFRRRYLEFHRTPPILGLVEHVGGFVHTPDLFPAQPDRPDGIAMDCRHGRALFLVNTLDRPISDLVVLDPMTGHQRNVPWPPHGLWLTFSAAVLCAAQGCDHHGCQGGHFLVALVSTEVEKTTSGWLYSSETRGWTELTSAHHPDLPNPNASFPYTCNHGAQAPSVLVGDALYFKNDGIIECQLGTLCLSVFQKPTDSDGTVMVGEDGGLGFAALAGVTNLTLWSRRVTGPEGTMLWAKLRVIDLEKLNPEFFTDTLIPDFSMVGCFAEGTQVMFMFTLTGTYMVNLKSGRTRKLSACYGVMFPYMSFYIPAMEAAL